MPRPTRDLTGASFGEPWLARDTRTGRRVARVTVHPREGQRFILQRAGATDRAAMAALEAAMAGRPEARETPATLRDVWAAWEKAQRSPDTRTVSESTRLLYSGVWARHVEPQLGNREAGSLTKAELYAWVHETPRSCRPKSVVDVLRAIYRFGVNAGLVANNPTAGGFDLHTPEPQPRPLPADTMLRVEHHLASLQSRPRGRRQDAALLLHTWVVMRGTAARIGEVLGMQVRDWTPATRQLRIGEHHIGRVESGAYREDGTPKVTYGPIVGAKTLAGKRTVTVPRDVAAVLDERCLGRKPNDWVFATADGRFVSPENLRTRLRRELKVLGLDGVVTPHDLRDTAASALAGALTQRYGLQAGLRAAASQLGHAGVGRALKAYVADTATVEDHSSVLEQTNPLHGLASSLHDRLAGARGELSGWLGSARVDFVAGVVTLPVHPDYVAAAERELALMGLSDLVRAAADEMIQPYDPDRVF